MSCSISTAIVAVYVKWKCYKYTKLQSFGAWVVSIGELLVCFALIIAFPLDIDSYNCHRCVTGHDSTTPSPSNLEGNLVVFFFRFTVFFQRCKLL